MQQCRIANFLYLFAAEGDVTQTKFICTILGHRQLSTTARYLHWYPPKPLVKFDLLAEALTEADHD